MENRKTIESLGFVIKKEKIANLASEHKFSELILEDLDPYPGFYDHYHIPVKEEEQKPRSIFAVIKTRGLDEMDDFIRITRHIKKTTNYTFDAVMGWLELQNSISGCIRIYMNDYHDLPGIIGLYSKYGIEFLANRVIKPFISLITVRKYMVIEEIDPGIYRDTAMADIYYLEAERYLSRPRFEKISDSIRNNWEHKIYDAAQAGIYSREGVVELIRIYDRATNIENLRYLKDKYYLEFSREI